MEKITTLVFDIGGIILDDTDGPLLKALGCTEERLRELQQIAFGDERWGQGVMIGEYDTEQYLEEKIAEFPEEERELEIMLSSTYHKTVLPLRQENVDFIRELHNKGEYKMYWLSNMDGAEYQYLNEEGIIEMLDGGCFSNIEHSKKPWSEFYERFFTKYNLRPQECWFFDDKVRNIDAGEQMGMRGTVVPTLRDMKRVVMGTIKTF